MYTSSRDRLRRLESRLLVGPVGHFLGGALDLAGALWVYAVSRARSRSRTRPTADTDSSQ